MADGGRATDAERELGDSLPTWTLADLYSGPDAKAIADDLQWAREASEAFRADYAGKLSALSGAALGAAITRYEAIHERLQRLASYAQLRFSENMADPERGRFHQTVQERINDISLITLFFTLELNRIDDAVLARQLQDPVAAAYAPWVRDSRVFRPHQLSDELEAVLHEKSVVGDRAWIRLFEQTLAGMRFAVDGERLTLSDALNRLSHVDEGMRRTAAKAIGAGLGEQIELFALVTNTLVKDKEIDDRWRHYPTPVSYRNLTNYVEDHVVDALVEAVRSASERLGHRYYRLKARWFGKEALDYWDRNAPLPDAVERRYGWQQARQTVLDAFAAFSPPMADLASAFFDNGWIDAAPRPGKDSGAFAHSTVPSAHPYILMNFYGRPRCVTTLAHELGHGVHQRLAARQGLLMSHTPLTLAETASVFGEMLVFRALLDGERDARKRRQLLASKIEDMLNTVVRQIAFFEFEKRVHDERRAGELSSERLGEIWRDVQSQSLGPGIRFDDEYNYYWAYISHFVHSPFYVYAYAFGDCLVNSLYQVYRSGMSDFATRYQAMLEAGGTLRHRELLQPFGLDAGDPDFWRRGVDVIAGLIDELAALD